MVKNEKKKNLYLIIKFSQSKILFFYSFSDFKIKLLFLQKTSINIFITGIKFIYLTVMELAIKDIKKGPKQF
jgi:hypothetical protein